MKMMMRRAAVCALVLCAGTALSQAAVGNANPADTRSVQQDFPGLRVERLTKGSHAPIRFWGVPMNAGLTSPLAAQQWLATYATSFEAGDLDLRLHRQDEVRYGKFDVFEYQQYMDGLPVENATCKVLVLNRADALHPDMLTHRVVSVSGLIAPRPAAGFAPDTVTADEAVAGLKKFERFAALESFSVPELVVFNGGREFADRIEAVHAWKFTGWNKVDAHHQAFTFFVDAATGQLLHSRDEVCNVNITGNVRAMATPGSTANVASNPPVFLPLNELRVDVVGSNETPVFTDALGNFTIPWTGTTPVMLRLSTTGAPANGQSVSGRWVTIDNNAGAEITVTRPATPGTAANLTMSTSTTEADIAQMNVLRHTNFTHTLFRSRAPSFGGINLTIQANVMIDDACNAFFSNNPAPSINFFNEAGGCSNTGFSSVVNHEYGHFIVNRLGLMQGAFGEGFSDCMSILVNDDPFIGRQFQPGGPNDGTVRAPNLSNRTYPCDGNEAHYCGEIIAGVCWEMRSGFVATYGQTNGYEANAQLFVDWALITEGSDPNNPANSAYPGTAIEYLTLDDTDGKICNGTPNYQIIASAFIARNIESPEAETRASISPVGDLPEIAVLEPGVEVGFNVVTEDLAANVIPGTARVLYRFGPTLPEQSLPMTMVTDTSYIALLPVLFCTQQISYRLAVDTDQGTVFYPPEQCHEAPLRARSEPADAVVVGAFDFEDDTGGWTASTNIPGSDGMWERAVPTPIPTYIAIPNSDATVAGTFCFVTENGSTATPPADSDVDHSAILTSPRFDLTDLTDVMVSYKRWFSNGTGMNPYQTGIDDFLAQVSNDDGATWTTAEVVDGSEGPDNAGGWRDGYFTLSSANVRTTDQVRFRFIVNDGSTDSFVEAGVDDILIRGVTCSVPSGCDSIDFNNDGLFPDTADIDDFLSVFAGNPCSTGTCNDIDFNNDGLFPDTSDIDSLLAAFAGNPC